MSLPHINYNYTKLGQPDSDFTMLMKPVNERKKTDRRSVTGKSKSTHTHTLVFTTEYKSANIYIHIHDYIWNLHENWFSFSKPEKSSDSSPSPGNSSERNRTNQKPKQRRMRRNWMVRSSNWKKKKKIWNQFRFLFLLPWSCRVPSPFYAASLSQIAVEQPPLCILLVVSSP